MLSVDRWSATKDSVCAALAGTQLNDAAKPQVRVQRTCGLEHPAANTLARIARNRLTEFIAHPS